MWDTIKDFRDRHRALKCALNVGTAEEKKGINGKQKLVKTRLLLLRHRIIISYENILQFSIQILLSTVCTRDARLLSLSS